MKLWWMLIFFITPLRQVENIQFCFSSQQHYIFPDYANSNFSQKIHYQRGKTFSQVKNLNFFELDLHFRIFLNHQYVQTLHEKVREILANLPVDSMTLREFLIHVGDFLKKNIQYSDENFPQDPFSVVMSRKANCIGYSNLFHTLLKSVGVKSRFVKGFYLKRRNGNSWIPIPHRWIEISPGNGYKYFYDPQYQDFSANYVVVKDEVAITSIKKFQVHLIKKNTEVINR